MATWWTRAAGAAYVTQRAFHVSFISYLIGLMVTASGLTSMATSTNVFTRTVLGLTTSQPDAAMQGWPWYLVALSFLGFMTLVNFRGMRESMWANILCTLVETGGLLFIIAIGARYWGSVDHLETPRATFGAGGELLDHGVGLGMLLGGSVLTFFSFIGFEDMLNVPEEVRQGVEFRCAVPRRNSGAISGVVMPPSTRMSDVTRHPNAHPRRSGARRAPDRRWRANRSRAARPHRRHDLPGS